MKLECWRSTVIIVVALAVVVRAARGLLLRLPSPARKCVSIELDNNVVVSGHYYAFNMNMKDSIDPTISVQVTSPYGNNLYHHEKVVGDHGQFGVTTTESGNYSACFSVDGEHDHVKNVTLAIYWTTEFVAKDDDIVSRTEKIKALRANLKKLNKLHQSLNYRTNRYLEMRNVDETTEVYDMVLPYDTFVTKMVWISGCTILYLGVYHIVVWAFRWLRFFSKRYFRKEKLV